MLDILAELRAHVARKYVRQTHAAAAFGVSPAFLSGVLKGKKKPTKAILDDAGIERIDVYQFKEQP